jgi:hypothetical protein
MVCKACKEGKICPKCINKLSKPLIAPPPPSPSSSSTAATQQKPSLWQRFKEGFTKAAENYQKAMEQEERKGKGKNKGKGKDSWGFSWDFDWDDLGLEPPSSTTRRRKKSRGYRLELGGWDF